MVLASRRAWVDIDHLSMILGEDGYYQVQDKDVVPGDLAVYSLEGNLAHVALVVQHEPTVETAKWKTLVVSQWGDCGEYCHDVNDVSHFLGKPIAFWSERVK